MIYKYCKRCGRQLKSEENRLRGFGKVCFERARIEAKNEMSLIVPLSNYPIEIDLQPKGEEVKNQQSQKAKQSQGEAKQNQSKAKSQGEAVQILQSQSKKQGGKPPHLEETLTPTSKKPLLFTPHIVPPTP